MQIIFPSILGYEVIARDAVAALARRCGISSERVEDVKTALCEACTNAIEHGNRLDPRRKVQVVCAVDEQRFVIEVRDEGGLLPMLPRKPI
ncbi:ATP-binding protein, partial [Chloroflexus sp.]|uniref:ATP-binding protein n=1 Tax=Chloroflexus sp. TaxID=1904827 RepID=UPI00298ED1DF